MYNSLFRRVLLDVQVAGGEGMRQQRANSAFVNEQVAAGEVGAQRSSSPLRFIVDHVGCLLVPPPPASASLYASWTCF